MASRRIYWLLRAAAATIAFGVASYPLSGQTASLTARAEVTDVALSLLNVQDLSFGDVTPGLSTTIDPQISANAGTFEIRGASGAEITLDMNVPPALTVGPFSMPVSFGGAAGCHHNRYQQDKCTYFDPSTTLVTNIRNRKFPENLRIVWFGGTASPTGTQFPGVYRGTVTLTAAYTGN
jgi:hypothetical protein